VAAIATKSDLRLYDGNITISIPIFLLFKGCPKVAQPRVGFKVLPGCKRHRIRHLEFSQPRLLTTQLNTMSLCFGVGLAIKLSPLVVVPQRIELVGGKGRLSRIPVLKSG
jgi:hypothetical protein